jgi:hypothetical protein
MIVEHVATVVQVGNVGLDWRTEVASFSGRIIRRSVQSIPIDMRDLCRGKSAKTDDAEDTHGQVVNGSRMMMSRVTA